MSDRVDVGAPASWTAPRDAAPSEAGVAPQTGSWNGQEVTFQPNVLSLLENAKEELTFLHSESVEQKKVEDRQVEETEESLRERVQRVQELLDEVRDLSREELEALSAELRANRATSGRILEEVRERFGEPSHAFVALEHARTEAEREGDADLAGRITTARDALMAEEGPAVRAGLNVTRAAMDSAGDDARAAAALRDGYRDAVFGRPGPASVYKGILARFGVEDFAERLRFLTRAAGDELASLGPSVERPRLTELLDDLSALRKLDTVHDRCGDLCRRVGKVAGQEIAPVEVMRRLLPLTEETITGSGKLIAIPTEAGVPAARLDACILFMREAREVLAMMPPGVFRDLDARFDVLRGMQEAMDQLIETEENEG